MKNSLQRTQRTQRKKYRKKLCGLCGLCGEMSSGRILGGLGRESVSTDLWQIIAPDFNRGFAGD